MINNKWRILDAYDYKIMTNRLIENNRMINYNRLINYKIIFLMLIESKPFGFEGRKVAS
ncbi:hypothetical protein AK40_5650 (plasmid) [Bacillus cereus 03BB108]|uniref:Uncharacterized protein n=1 Tax=Bacillus cereus 03BB108 TaxID=451709 RepID=A0AAN0SR36_BACCE|nr:hypothetical protein AK40_5650 [Bacillus cereus 03BB108]